MGKVLDVQCPHCSAPVHFSAKIGKMHCEYCGYEFDASEIKQETTEEVVDTQEVVEDESDVNYVRYNCPDCGAEIITEENTAATFCLYCGNTSIIRSRLEGKFAPSLIIPFKTEKEKAIEAFKNIRKGRPFVPASFNSEANIEKITGLYIPFWLYDITVDGKMDGTATKVKHWTTGNTHYTKTDYYNVERAGKMYFKRVPVDGSKKFDNDIMNTIEPFDYKELVKYNHAYLSGFLAEKYDVDSEEAFEDAKARVLVSGKETIDKSLSYATVNRKNEVIEVTDKQNEYVLLPVWMVSVKYNNEFYIFAMNGQTGEFVGNIPLDKKKVFLYTALVFLGVLIIFLIGSLLMYYV
ncbi:MAG: DNA helicase PriA [Bacilli bacterium]|nr:DNA helicase PriA [Bacilli bacterium]